MEGIKMIFYRVKATIEQKNEVQEESQERERRSLSRQRAEMICAETTVFNSVFDERYIFTVSAHKSRINMNVISKEPITELYIQQYLSTIDVQSIEIQMEEVTWREIYTSVCTACRAGFLEDEDFMFKQMKLTRVREFHNCDETVLEVSSKKSELVKESRRLLSSSLREEVDRILAKSHTNEFVGHPVHYLIETDDKSVYERMVNVLLNALYKAGRIQCQRYSRVPLSKLARQHRVLYKYSIGGTVCIECDDNVSDDMEYADLLLDDIQLSAELLHENKHSVLTIFWLPKSNHKAKNMLFSHVENCTFVEIKEDIAFGREAKNYLKNKALEQHVEADDKLFTVIKDSKTGFIPSDLNRLFDNWFDEHLKSEKYPQYASIDSVKKANAKQKPRGNAYEELRNMIGLKNAKSIIDEALNYYKAQKLFCDKGLQEEHPSMHMVFTGNPGTAKTTVARLFAQIMKDNGVLSEGTLHEVGRADLVGKYVGWTAQMVKDKFKKAKGGVLFIDEAYSLLDDKSGMYGDEAINTIVQEMENNREDMVVIFAGYPNEMENFLSRNPGLRSRIAYHVPFDDYDVNELFDITELLAKNKGLSLGNGVREKLLDMFRQVINQKDYGNGRYARNVLEKAKMKQASRLVGMNYEEVTRDMVTMLLPEDFEMPCMAQKKERKIGFV